MNAKLKPSAPAWTDPDDAPEITEQWVAEADLFKGDKLVRRGRPVGSTQASVKRPTTLRLDESVLARFGQGLANACRRVIGRARAQIGQPEKVCQG